MSKCLAGTLADGREEGNRGREGAPQNPAPEGKDADRRSLVRRDETAMGCATEADARAADYPSSLWGVVDTPHPALAS